jgi:hypothetical protein
VCSHAALESFGFEGPIKEPGRNPQRANPVTYSPCGSNSVGLAIHLSSSAHELRAALAERTEKLQGCFGIGPLSITLKERSVPALHD